MGRGAGLSRRSIELRRRASSQKIRGIAGAMVARGGIHRVSSPAWSGLNCPLFLRNRTKMLRVKNFGTIGEAKILRPLTSGGLETGGNARKTGAMARAGGPMDRGRQHQCLSAHDGDDARNLAGSLPSVPASPCEGSIKQVRRGGNL